MPSETGQHDSLVGRIVAVELQMFERVRTSEPSLCQERPEAFRSMRAMTHSVLSEETLRSYLADLERAAAEGRNLMTLKYARMGGQIPPLKDNPLIAEIVRIESRWMKELAERYPHVIRGGPDFENYLACELETYSDETIALYHRDVSQAVAEGRNLAEERYNWLFSRIGYGSIAEAERRARNMEERQDQS